MIGLYLIHYEKDWNYVKPQTILRTNMLENVRKHLTSISYPLSKLKMF